MAEKQKSGKFVPIDWFVPDDIITRYVTNMVVQTSGHEVIISFFEAQPPIIVGPMDKKQKDLESIDSVRARCVARIAIAPARMEEFVRVLTDQLQRSRNAGTAKKGV